MGGRWTCTEKQNNRTVILSLVFKIQEDKKEGTAYSESVVYCAGSNNNYELTGSGQKII